MGRNNRRRASRANVRTLPTSKTHAYWARHRRALPDPRNRMSWSERHQLDLFDSGYTPWQVRELKRLQRQAVRMSVGKNLNRPTVASPARYGPQRFFSPGVVAAAAVAAGQGRKNDISVCEERQVRKEVMFATGKAGQRGQRSPIWTQKSKMRCK